MEDLIQKHEPHTETVEINPKEDIALLPFTGGTTGQPKGVMLTQEGMDFSCQSIALYERYAQSDKSLCFLPFNDQ